MATVVKKKDDASAVVDCANCGATVHYQDDELRLMNDKWGFACPNCSKNLDQDGALI